MLVPAAAAWWDPATTILVTMEPPAAFSAPSLSPRSHTSRDVIQWKVIAALLLGSGRGLQLGGGGLATSLRMMGDIRPDTVTSHHSCLAESRVMHFLCASSHERIMAKFAAPSDRS